MALTLHSEFLSLLRCWWIDSPVNTPVVAFLVRLSIRLSSSAAWNWFACQNDCHVAYRGRSISWEGSEASKHTPRPGAPKLLINWSACQNACRCIFVSLSIRLSSTAWNWFACQSNY